MENSVELLNLKCASCGAGLNSIKNQTEVKCTFCNNITKILYPVKVSPNSATTSGADSVKLDNLVSIMEKSMAAGNYKEAYDYCNKALEIYPDSSSLWENKAICTYSIKDIYEHIENSASDIITYLNTAKQYSPDSNTYEYTSSSLAENLFSVAQVFYSIIKSTYDDKFAKIIGFTEGKEIKPLVIEVRGEKKTLSENVLVKIIKLVEACFNISPQKKYLEYAVNELSTKRWINIEFPLGSFKGTIVNSKLSQRNNFDAINTRNIFIQKIRAIDTNYQPPELELNTKSKSCFIATATMGSYNHPVVKDLRIFRDSWLLKRKWGKSFTEFYYLFGPYPAKLISKSTFLKKISYHLIIFPIHKISKFLLKK